MNSFITVKQLKRLNIAVKLAQASIKGKYSTVQVVQDDVNGTARITLGDHFSTYGGSFISQSNLEYLYADDNCKLFESTDDFSRPCMEFDATSTETSMKQWVDAIGFLVECQASVAISPLLDENRRSELEHESQSENWLSWGASEYAELWTKYFATQGIDLDELSLDQWALLSVAQELDYNNLETITEDNTSYYRVDESSRSVNASLVSNFIDIYNDAVKANAARSNQGTTGYDLIVV